MLKIYLLLSTFSFLNVKTSGYGGYGGSSGYGYGDNSVKECNDKAPWCKAFVHKNRHRCYQESFYMLTNCPYSCYQCQLCGDNFARCNEYKVFCHADRDPKTGKTVKFRMHHHCRETCQICKKTNPGPGPGPDPDPESTTVYPPDASTGTLPCREPFCYTGTSYTRTSRPRTTHIPIYPPITMGPGGGDEITHNITNPYLGKRYIVYKTDIYSRQLRRAEAKARCKSLNSNFRLLVVHDAEEIEFLRKNLEFDINSGTMEHYWWTGASMNGATSIWSWDDSNIPFDETLLNKKNNHGCVALQFTRDKDDPSRSRMEIVTHACFNRHHWICQLGDDLTGVTRVTVSALDKRRRRNKGK